MTTNQTIDGVPREFVREGRYIVVRPDHEDDLRTERLRNYIEEMCFHTPDCVVVEADWPEYEKVWGMIEARVTGRQTELDSALATIAHLRDDLEGTRLLAADQLLKIKQQRAEIYRLKSGKGEPAACAVKLSPARGERINAVEKPVNRRVCHACIGLNREVFCHICDNCDYCGGTGMRAICNKTYCHEHGCQGGGCSRTAEDYRIQQLHKSRAEAKP